MTVANWKTNEVQKSSLDSDVCVFCVEVCVCERETNEVQSERSALSRADAHKTNKNAVKEQLLLFFCFFLYEVKTL